ncbi:hypothetical protein D3C81_726160 [compost metagenome]
MQGRATVEDVDVVLGLEALTHEDVESDLRARMHLAHGFLRSVRQQGHIDRVVRHQLGEEGAALQAAQALGVGVVEVEEVAADGIPERRFALIVAVADDLGDHRIGEALGVRRHEQQAPARIELGPAAAHQLRQHIEAGQQAVAGQVVAQRQHVNLVVDLQFARGMHEGFVAKAVERLGVTGRGNDGRAADQLAGQAVFEHEEVAFLAIEADFGGEGGLGRGDLVAQASSVVRQRGDTNGAVCSHALHFVQISHLRGAHHQHGVTPLE